MTRKSKARYGLKRTYRISPTVKALRAALLAGVMAASLAPSAATAAPFRDVVIEDDVAVGDAFVYNEEELAALAENIAAGILVYSVNGDAGVVNHGDISAVADASLGLNGNFALAAGIYAYAKYEAVIVNDGNISATAIAEANGSARAYGLWAYGGESAVIENAGNIEVYATSEFGNSTATGIYAGSYGDTVVDNTGSISATALVSYSDYNGYATTASAIGIDASGYSVSIDNSGDIDAFASNDLYFGASVAIGINAEAYADITISNSGDISLSGASGDGYAFGGYYPNYFYVTGDFVATGINAESTNGSISISNSGDISIVDLNEDGVAGGFRTGDRFIGINATTQLGDSTITNSGDITIAGGEEAIGIVASTNFVEKSITCYETYTCYVKYGGGDATVVNSGDITISSGIEQEYRFSYAVGISASTNKYGGDAIVSNSGDITITNNADGDAVGINARSTGKYAVGSTIVSNSGDISVTSPYQATGIWAESTNDSSIYNSGDITVASVEGRARALYAVTDQVALISNSGDISVVGGIGAIGIGAAGAYGATTINTGDISVASTRYVTLTNYYGEEYYAGGWAYGAFASSRFLGVATVINSGDIDVNGITRGTGVSANSRFGSTYIANEGNLTVNGELESAYGIQTTGSGYEEFLNGEIGYSTVINQGDITATSGGLAVGIQAQQGYGNVQVYNAGDINVSAGDDEYGNAFGLVASTGLGTVTVANYGDISAVSGANAIGIFADSVGYVDANYQFYADVNVSSSGDILVQSAAGRATGIQATSSYGDVVLDTAGSIDVSGGQRTRGIVAKSQYGAVTVNNGADISASSTSEYARGIEVFSDYGDVSVTNDGSITVTGTSLVQGIQAGSYYGAISIVNNGDISVESSGYSNAIAVNSGAQGATVVNYGSLEATGDDAWTVNAVGGALGLYNYGAIFGSMIADGGDDYIYNGEGGRIFLSDDTIDLGYGNNYFLNEGRVYANGASNVIYMGYSGDGEGGYSYGLFVNNGSSIHMDDGAADDALTIIGDFAGTGDVNVDVDGASLSSDRLYIEGNVLAGTANTVNISLLSLPTAADLVAGETIDIVSVSGSSVASNFVLGSVDTTDTALFTVDYGLVFSGGDYSLSLEATGLSTAGVLLTSAAPAIQSLWYGSLGTMYQRQGAERWFSPDGKETDGSAAVWGRYYANDGAMSPDAKRGNFGDGGSQNFDFSSNGIELGVGYSFSQSWTIGVLAGTMEGDYKPESGGKTDIDGNTLGAYLTYVHGNGFYADLSYRSFDFDGDVYNGTEVLQLDGDASGYSLEMGYGFTTESKLEIEPQLQYSSVDVSIDDIAYGSGDYQQTDGDSSQFRLGVAFRKSYEHDSGKWTPYGALSYVNVSSASNDYVIGGALEGGVDTSGGSALLELGADARYNNWVFNAGVSMQDGGAYDFVFGGQLNVRYSW